MSEKFYRNFIKIYIFLYLLSILKLYTDIYGKGENNKFQIRNNLYSIIDKSNKEELKMYYKCICTIKGYVNGIKK